MKTLLLIDSHAIIHRAFHALPPFTSPTGEPTGALYGFSSILLKILKENPPDYIAATFDRPEPTFRDEMFNDYKAHRPAATQELINQIIKSHELMIKFGISYFEIAGYEADDIIGSLTEKFKNEPNLKIVILTGDLDTLQLVEDNHIVAQILKKGFSETMTYNEEAVKERYNITPKQMTDYKGLVGDSSDNIPGIKGIGPKTAAKIISEFKNLENLFEELTPNHPLGKKILPQKEQAILSKKLATIKRDIPLKFQLLKPPYDWIEVELKNLAYAGLPKEDLTQYFTKLGFYSLIKRI